MRLELILNNIIEGKIMGEYLVKRPLKRPPVHPGEILREDVFKNLGLSVSEAARRLGDLGQRADVERARAVVLESGKPGLCCKTTPS